MDESHLIDYDFVWNHVPGEKPQACEAIDFARFKPLALSPAPSIRRIPSSESVDQERLPVEPTHQLTVHWRNFRVVYSCNFDPATSALSAVTLCDLNLEMCNALSGKDYIDLTTEPRFSTNSYTEVKFLPEKDENGNRYLQYRISFDGTGCSSSSMTLLGKRKMVSLPRAEVPLDELKRLGLWDEAG